MKITIALLMTLVSINAHALTCPHEDRALERAEIIISLIPMSGEILIKKAPDAVSEPRSNRSSVFEVEVYKVWKGEVNFRESLVFYGPRIFSLGSEYIVATNKNKHGELVVGACTLARDVFREKEWAIEKLGEPIYEFEPTIFSP